MDGLIDPFTHLHAVKPTPSHARAPITVISTCRLGYLFSANALFCDFLFVVVAFAFFKLFPVLQGPLSAICDAVFPRRSQKSAASSDFCDFVDNTIMKGYELYLVGYNFAQVLGWGAVLVKTVLGIAAGKTNEELYDNVALELAIFQTAAILEIVHAAVGFVRSPIATTATQVFSRVVVVWTILYKVPSSRSSIGVLMLLLAWSITEVVRYSFYALGLLKSVPFALTWMRYTFFIVLYPLGASGEVITMIAALPEIWEKKHLSFELPNSFNFGFSYYYFVIILCLYYLPGFPQLYGYMFQQRKKYVTNAGSTEGQKKKA